MNVLEILRGYFSPENPGVYCQSCGGEIHYSLPRTTPEGIPETRADQPVMVINSKSYDVHCMDLMLASKLEHNSDTSHGKLAQYYSFSQNLVENLDSKRQVRKAIREGDLVHFGPLEEKVSEEVA